MKADAAGRARIPGTRVRCSAVTSITPTEPAPPISELCMGLKCGGSDGFSGLSANPAIGYTADLVAALGGTAILAEFPELCGVEQELINRCVRKEVSDRFIQLVRDYAARAK